MSHSDKCCMCGKHLDTSNETYYDLQLLENDTDGNNLLRLSELVCQECIKNFLNSLKIKELI